MISKAELTWPLKATRGHIGSDIRYLFISDSVVFHSNYVRISYVGLYAVVSKIQLDDGRKMRIASPRWLIWET